MRAPLLLVALALAVSCVVHANEGGRRFRYGPMTIHGEGYKDEMKDGGFWKVEGGDGPLGRALAIDVAIYRAAELARAAGHRYVELHDAVSRRQRLGKAERVTFFARPADAPVHPAACRSGESGRCYTADVAVVFARLSGEDMRQPGVAAPSHIDEHGRTVFVSGFGIGAVGGEPARR